MSVPISPVSPDSFEKSSLHTNHRTQSSRSTVSSSSRDWYLSKRGSRCSSRSSTSSSSAPSRAAVTPLPPSIEVSLAILTSGLSVAAFHGIRSIAEKRAAKKLALQTPSQNISLARTRSILVPSTVPEQLLAPPTELPAAIGATLIAELDGSPRGPPPPYFKAS